MPRQLFRQVALDRLASPERLDELMVVSPPRTWLTLLGLWLVLLAALIWGVYGTIPSLLRGQGVLIREGSMQSVDAPAAGELRELLVNVGDDVTREQLIARIVQPTDNRTVMVTSPHAGRVREVRTGRGDQVVLGAPLLILEQPGGQLEAILYLPPADARKVLPGMEVQIAPASVKREQYGLLLGRVAAIGALPASPAGMRRVLGSDELMRAVTGDGPVVELRVRLERTPTTATGYQWTSTLSSLGSLVVTLFPEPLGALVPNAATPGGPPLALTSGTPFTADVITDRRAPVELVLARIER